VSTDTSPLSRATAREPADRRSGRTEVAASVALAAIAFIIVTGETTPVGLISEVARGVRTGESQIGLVISWYALIAGATAVPLTRLSSRFDRRRVLLVCAVVFAAGHVVTAVATNIQVLLLGRGLAALSHGVYFAVAMPAALRLARPEARGRAGGRVAVGAASAFVLGTPLSTLLGQTVGWRTVMLVIAGLSLALAVAVARLLPPLPPLHLDQPRSAGGVLATLRSRELIGVLGVSLLVVLAHFALLTYVAPYADERLGVRGTALTVLLLAYGVAAVLGSSLGGRLADRAPVTGVRVAAATFVTALIGLWLAARLDSPLVGVPLLVLWGGAFSTLAVSTALAVLRRARGPQAETANALHGIVFQVGIVAGSALGSLCYAAGQLSAVPLAAAAGGLAALVLLARVGRAFRRGPTG
jgi:predicted MFS family arabinose efflux permease